MEGEHRGNAARDQCTGQSGSQEVPQGSGDESQEGGRQRRRHQEGRRQRSNGGLQAVRVTVLRNPCAQIEAFVPGLLAAVLDRTHSGEVVRKAGVMGVVLESGRVHPGDPIVIEHSS